MAGQVQKQHVDQRRDDPAAPMPAPADRSTLGISDELLDEIDAVLEDEEIARTYIQRGGE